MNYKNIVFITIVGGLFINPLLAISIKDTVHESDQKRQKYISIAKKVGAAIGIAVLAISGGLGSYFYLRHRKKKQIIDALECGDFEQFKKLTLSCFAPSDAYGSGNILHYILDQSPLLREGKMEETIRFVMHDVNWNIDINKKNAQGTTPLFATMDKLVFHERADHYVTQLLQVIDFLIANGAEKNCIRNDNHTVVVAGVATKNGSLLHSAATIVDDQVRNKVIAHLIAKGVDQTIKDDYGHVYQTIIRKPSIYENL